MRYTFWYISVLFSKQMEAFQDKVSTRQWGFLSLHELATERNPNGFSSWRVQPYHTKLSYFLRRVFLGVAVAIIKVALVDQQSRSLVPRVETLRTRLLDCQLVSYC